jgi:methylthioribulose-1-phosphate dehydratase
MNGENKAIRAIPMEDIQRAFEQLARIKEGFAAKGWFAGTSGNLSLRVGDTGAESLRFVVTASGKDKSASTPEDFLLVDEQGKPAMTTGLKPSAETLIHCEIYRLTDCGAVFHIHTVFNNLVSELYGEQGAVPIAGIELIKAFNIWDEGARIEVPIVPNHAEIPRIADLIKDAIHPQIPGILLRNHGIYAWGANAFEAKKHLEAFEFLFEYVYRWELLKGSSRK